MRGTYDKLSLEDFSVGLFETQDLDPIYVMLHEADLDDATLRRWVLAYWCFYHAGTASDIAEADDFYEAAYRAYADTRSRGTERRHFRGDNGLKSLDYLRRLYPEPERALDDLLICNTFDQVVDTISAWPGFGPWIAFKAADMLERVFGVDVDFDSCQLALYDAPVKGAQLYDPDSTLEEIVSRLVVSFSSYKAPPMYDRRVNVQEVETCLCKWKSHMNGHYKVGNDIYEIRHHLTEDGKFTEDGILRPKHGALAERLLEALPPLPETWGATPVEPPVLFFFRE